MSTNTATMTTAEVAERFNQLAQQEKWFQIQDELFADNVRSVEPVHSRFLSNAEGKANVRSKGETFVKRIEALHSASTTEPVVSGNFFAVVAKTSEDATGGGKETTIRCEQSR